MSDDPYPRWPPDWVEGHDLAAEETVAQSEQVSLASALRADDRVLLSVSWPGGRRYLLVDPVGNDAPQALRAGERSGDPDIDRAVDTLWSQALGLAKALIDGELPAAPDASPPRRLPWRRRDG